MASVEIEGLTKWYGKRRGVENISFNLADKEFLTVFGPAGAGKTTTLNLIAGIVTPNQGSVKIAGCNIDGLEPAERNIAMVFESYALYPQLTVFENMAFPLRSPKYKQPEKKVKERVVHYAKVMKIDHLLDRQIQALSNGQRQRTALGRALVRQPDVFLFDEPLSHLDAKLRHSMRAELKEMRSQLGTTTIYVTHDYLEAMSLGDRVAVINEGRIHHIGTPKEVYFRPTTMEVARLFGDPEINLVMGQLKAKGLQLVVQILGENVGIEVPPDAAEPLRTANKVYVGFRPADVNVIEGNSKTALHGVVYSFEPLGTKSVLTVDAADGTRIRALIDGRRTIQIDRRIQFTITPHSLMFFDADTHRFLFRSKVPIEEVANG